MELLNVLQTISFCLVIFVAICNWYHVGYLLIPHMTRLKPHKPEKQYRYAVLIAARNEEQVLPHLLRSILAQDYPSDKITIYVVADNCTDATARVARELGTEVLERFNRKKVGKGYALHDLLSYIKKLGRWEEYDAFLVFDADNLLKSDYVRNINRTHSDGYEAFCGYRNTKNFGTNWLTSGYGLMFLHDCIHMNRSRMALGSSCIVSGTGFGCTRSVLDRCDNWNFFTLTEDTQFSYWCAANGIRVGYCPDAELYDEQPVTFRQSWRQRTRWVQGSFQLGTKCGPALVKGILRGSYSCYECLNMSVWGYSLAAFSAIFSLVLVFLKDGAVSGAIATCSVLCNIYISLFLMGSLTLLTQWKRIRATAGQKVASLFTYPIFMMTFVPITVVAPFVKFQWKPIQHRVAISTEALLEK